jgi:outer membrane protein assembly complex protein YaeT
VREVSFEGNDAIDDYTLSISIATSQSPWMRRHFWIRWLGLGTPRYFDELEFRRDVLRLQLLYRQHGYYEARIDTTVRRARDHIRVTFRIEEGLPVVVDTITIMREDSAIRPRRLIARMPLKEGEPLNRFEFEASSDTLLFSARERGYPFAAVFRSYSVDRTAREADVSYLLMPGPLARIGEIVIDSASGVRPSLVRRFLSFREGDVYRQSALFSSQRTLYRTDMFRFVAVGVDRDSTVGGSDSLVRIRVSVADAPRARMRVGAGFGTIDCFRTQATATVANFAGGGRRLDLAGKLSKLGVGEPTSAGLEHSLCKALADSGRVDRFSDTVNYQASATVTQPALFTRNTTGSITGFAERRSEFRVYENIQAGAALSLAFGAGVPAGVTLTYRIARSRTNADPGTFCTAFDRCEQEAIDILSRSRRQATLGLALTDIHVNSVLDPSAGHVLTADLTAAARTLYSEVVFAKAVGEASWYRPLTRRSVMALRARAGIIRTGISTIDSIDFRFVPPDERFYLGGPTTIRGFGRNAMGRVVYVASHDTNVVVGADSSVLECRRCRTSPLGASVAVLLGNAELRTPSPLLPDLMRLAFFVDAGRLWQEPGAPPTDWRVTPGVGLRFITPLGPMRFDVGYGPARAECGNVYVVRESGSSRSLDRVGDDAFCPPSRGSFLRRLQYHFSVGQAY